MIFVHSAFCTLSPEGRGVCEGSGEDRVISSFHSNPLTLSGNVTLSHFVGEGMLGQNGGMI